MVIGVLIGSYFIGVILPSEPEVIREFVSAFQVQRFKVFSRGGLECFGPMGWNDHVFPCLSSEAAVSGCDTDTTVARRVVKGVAFIANQTPAKQLGFDFCGEGANISRYLPVYLLGGHPSSVRIFFERETHHRFSPVLNWKLKPFQIPWFVFCPMNVLEQTRRMRPN